LKFRTSTSFTLLVLAWLPFAVISAELESFSEEYRMDFSLPDFRDKVHSLADYQGKVVLINFWASWCPPCIYEMPELTRLKQQLADKPFEIIAINVGEKKYRVRKFTKLVNFELQVLLDTSSKAFNDWDVKTLPTSFLIDADGRVRHKIRGNPGWEQQETISLIEQLIAEGSAPAAQTN
jgi:thiol-disulfide isomerase/thioredoxin